MTIATIKGQDVVRKMNDPMGGEVILSGPMWWDKIHPKHTKVTLDDVEAVVSDPDRIYEQEDGTHEHHKEVEDGYLVGVVVGDYRSRRQVRSTYRTEDGKEKNPRPKSKLIYSKKYGWLFSLSNGFMYSLADKEYQWLIKIGESVRRRKRPFAANDVAASTGVPLWYVEARLAEMGRLHKGTGKWKGYFARDEMDYVRVLIRKAVGRRK